MIIHIQEHLNALTNNTDQPLPDLKDEDMVYYLFLIHDQNGDGFLDGHELRQAFTDFGHDEDVSKYLSLDEITEMVDHVLEEDDLNGDGLISWSEYLESQIYHSQS
ncbi:hypothetical protein RMATCC62417_02721 [Rhizopus microsporus]|nr:hypothetical protein RMATCC62417_02721 [Rhizopus microsporus]